MLHAALILAREAGDAPDKSTPDSSVRSSLDRTDGVGNLIPRRALRRFRIVV
jgi:hypothetical protein